MSNLNTVLGLDGRQVVLASGSPRRADLFKLIGLDCRIEVSHLDESRVEFELPEVHVLELSYKKAAKVAENIKDGLIIGADTVVVLRDRMLGKPESKKAAHDMLRSLSGETHTVYTGFTIIENPSGKAYNDFERTEVTFRNLSDAEIDAYVRTGSPMDKAGAYGIQDQSAIFVTGLQGCFYNVMGFPLTRFYVALRSFMQIN